MATALAGGVAPINTAPLSEMSRTISQASTQMFSLVTNLLTVNSAEQGLLKPTLSKTNVGAILHTVCEQFKEFAAVKNITLRIDASQSEVLNAIADEQMLREVLENLLSNAVKYSPHGKNVFVRMKAGNDAVRVEVQDEGQGISEEDRKKLFGKFSRLSARPTGGEHSTGLGLSIVKTMVEAMNGRVWCESEVGDGLLTGATFIVELPTAP
jgi:signal transduction histidine kinase